MKRQSNLAGRNLRFLLAVVVATLTLAGVAASRAQEENALSLGIENFGKVNENYYRGGQPDAESFARLKRLGIKTIIDLRKDSVRAEPEWVSAQGMRYFNIPMKASTPATEEQAAYFLKLVNDPDNWPVYVHCKGGRHRTGALTAIYRITRDGWTADQAYDEMKRYDFNNGVLGSLFGGPSAQKRFVYAFYQRHATGGSGK